MDFVILEDTLVSAHVAQSLVRGSKKQTHRTRTALADIEAGPKENLLDKARCKSSVCQSHPEALKSRTDNK